MPIYEYFCPTCQNKFSLRRSFGEADAAATCPQGHDGVKRMLSTFVSFSKGSNGETTRVSGTGSSCASCGGGSCAGCGG